MLENSMLFDTPLQPDNPTDEERYRMAKFALAQKGRPDDFEYIIKLMSPPPDITSFARPGEYKNIRVGIIGGGLAGMAAAFELRKLGMDITVFEAIENRLGGRVYTHYFNPQKTLYGEFGPMRMPVTHETLWHYLKLFKLKTRPFIQVNENGFIYLRQARVRNDPAGYNVMKYIYPRYCLNNWERITPWQQLTYYGLESHLLCTTSAARSEILQVKPGYNPHILYWDAESIRKVLERSGLSQDAINLIQNFSPLAGQNIYNSYLDYVQELYSVDLSFLYEIPGGIVNLPMSFYQSFTGPNPQKDYPGIPLQSLGRVTWKMGNWVEGIYRNDDSKRVTLAYRNKKISSQLKEHFDYVICTIPFSTLRTVSIDPLFSSAKMQAIKEIDYIPAQKTFLLCKQRFWEQGGPKEQIIGGASHTDLPITQIYYPSDHLRSCSGKINGVPWSNPSQAVHLNNKVQNDLYRQPGVLLASYNFNLEATRLSNMMPGLLFEEVKREIEMVHGLPKGYLNPIVSDYKTVNWNNEVWFRGALCYYTSEQKQLFSYAAACPEYNERVFFAGEHVSNKHRWMQGALQSGMEAANELARTCRYHFNSN